MDEIYKNQLIQAMQDPRVVHDRTTAVRLSLKCGRSAPEMFRNIRNHERATGVRSAMLDAVTSVEIKMSEYLDPNNPNR